jgi:hypothetical protein
VGYECNDTLRCTQLWQKTALRHDFFLRFAKADDVLPEVGQIHRIFTVEYQKRPLSLVYYQRYEYTNNIAHGMYELRVGEYDFCFVTQVWRAAHVVKDHNRANMYVLNHFVEKSMWRYFHQELR